MAEIDALKYDLEETRKSFDKLHKKYLELLNRQGELEKENKELITFKDKVFALIDARIEIYKHKPFMAPVSAPMSVNFDEDVDRLARLSELQELKKELKE